jgi:hypothetical protein
MLCGRSIHRRNFGAYLCQNTPPESWVSVLSPVYEVVLIDARPSFKLSVDDAYPRVFIFGTHHYFKLCEDFQ